MIAIQRTYRDFYRAAALAALAWVAVAAAAAPAAADDGSFSLKISEKEAAITDPSNADLQMFLMWDLGSDRVVSRNSPYLELKNESQAPITEFRMTIGDERFNFDCAFMQTCAYVTSAPSGLAVTPSVVGGDELVLSFGNGGLAVDQAVRFRIALGVDDGYNFFHMPDFRTVLFDMNENNVYDGSIHGPNGSDPTDDNSLVTVKFLLNGTTQSVGPVPFEDFAVTSQSANYYNNLFRRYGVMEPVETFLLLGPGEVVPEPTSGLLALFAMATGLVATRRTRRRR